MPQIKPLLHDPTLALNRSLHPCDLSLEKLVLSKAVSLMIRAIKNIILDSGSLMQRRGITRLKMCNYCVVSASERYSSVHINESKV